MLRASLNPNLTMADLQKLSDLKCEGIDRMGKAMVEGAKSLPTLEMRAQYMQTVLPIFLSFCLS